MFGRKRKEEIQALLNSAQKDRELFAEQAQKDRTEMSSQVAALKNDTNALIETMNEDRKAFADQAQKDRTEISAQVASLKNDTKALIETMNEDRKAFAEQAEKDRKVIFDHIESIKTNVKSTNDGSKEPAIEKGQELKAAYALNLCTVSVSQIIDYNDLAIMEQEYDNILNNLNLQNFPKDDALLKILKQILDVISFFRIQDGEKKLLEEQYKKKVKNAIWSAVPSPSVILAGGQAGWVGLAVSAISAVGTGYMNYRKERATIDDEKREKDWELQKAALEQFHALRRELFDTAWRLADTYDFDDSYRLTARQITQYNKILLEEDAEKRYERLYYIHKKFKAYPPFWYNLGHAAADVFHNTEKKYSNEVCIKFKSYALSAFDEFMKLTNEDKKNSLLREDQLRSACALEKFALISSDDSFSIEEKVKLLQIATKNSGNAFDTVQLCASAYLELGINENAIDLLRMLVNEDYNAEMNAQLLSMLYISMIRTDNQSYRLDHEVLCKRGYSEYMFPWPNYDLDNAAAKNHTNAFAESQNESLFEKYKEIVSEYINQCKTTFDDILQQSGDITDSLVDFLNGINKDVATLFGDDKFAQTVCDKMAEKLLEHQHAFCNERARKEAKELSFDSISNEALKDIAEKIIYQVYSIRKATEKDKMKKIACCMNNFLLFKAQTKLLGGNAISKINSDNAKTGFDKLIEQSKKNQADHKFVNIVKKYAQEENIIVSTGEKTEANFIIENLEASKHVKHKKDIDFNKAIAYLDTDHTDILFTTEGLYAYGGGLFGSGKSFAKYNSGNIILTDNKEIKINKITFKHKQVNVKKLSEMIEQLSNLAPREAKANTEFQQLVGEYPSKPNDEIKTTSYIPCNNSSATVTYVTQTAEGTSLQVNVQKGNFAVGDQVRIITSDGRSSHYDTICHIFSDKEQREIVSEGMSATFFFINMEKECADIGSEIMPI